MYNFSEVNRGEVQTKQTKLKVKKLFNMFIISSLFLFLLTWSPFVIWHTLFAFFVSSDESRHVIKWSTYKKKLLQKKFILILFWKKTKRN